MLAHLIALMLQTQGVETLVIDDRVFIEGRPGCEARPLLSGAPHYVIVCDGRRVSTAGAGSSSPRTGR